MPVRGSEEFPDFGDISDLPAQDEELAFADIGLQKARVLAKFPGFPHPGVKRLPDGVEHRLKTVKILADGAVGDVFRRFLFGLRFDVAQMGDVRVGAHIKPQFREQGVIAHGFGVLIPVRRRPLQEFLRVETGQNVPALLPAADLLKAGGINPLENVIAFGPSRQAAGLFDKAADVFEPGNDAFLTRRSGRGGLNVLLNA